MGLLITSIVLALIVALPITIGAIKFGSFTDDDGDTVKIPVAARALATVIVWLIALAPVSAASFTAVSTKNIGVVTTFNRPVGHLSNGLHLKAPWQKVTELDGAIQNETFTEKDKDALSVRLGNNSMATVDATVQWRIKPDAADTLFLDYRNFDSIKTNLVNRQLKSAMNDVLATFNPIASTSQVQGGSDNEKLAQRVTALLKERVGSRIDIKSVLIPVIHFDQNTQDRINAYQAEIGNTRIAEQKQATAKAEGEANRELSASVNNDPNVLVSKCLDIVAKNGGSPAGCWPGTSVIAGVK